jgi:16S rRNA (cytidine1402-2'-O)-methyltransferase
MAESGILYVVATPIGNLEDITLRAIRILKEVDVIAAEDTRRTRALLSHLGVSKPLVSYYDAVEVQRAPRLVQRLERGERIALVSDAGTPGLSDPGHRLVTAASQAGIPVVPIPGPSAITATLAVAGLPCERFAFEGFLPTRGATRTRRLEALRSEQRALVFFEAPHRLARTLEALQVTLGDRQAVMARELTKRYEEIRRGTLASLRDAVCEQNVRGEVTLVVAGVGREQIRGAHGEEDIDAVIGRALEAATREGSSIRDVVDRVVAERGGRRREVYRRTLALAAKGKGDDG